MKKLFFTLGLISCLSLPGSTGAEASSLFTFTAGQGCSCADADNWVDLNSPSSVSLTCAGAGNSTYNDTALPNNKVQEYSCSSFPGATPVMTDNISGKVMVSYIIKTCPKGYIASVIKKPIKLTATATAAEKKAALTVPTVSIGYCAKATVTAPSTPTAIK